MNLKNYNQFNFNRGASIFKELLWLFFSHFIISSCLPGSKWRVILLKLFGAKIGIHVVIKPGVKIKFPWRLTIGDFSWIGENCWIDNLVDVTIGDNVCISQGVFICTGSHDWTKSSFDLIVKPVTIESFSWLGAMSKVSLGVNVGEGSILSFGSVATKSMKPWVIYSGNPASFLRNRIK
jgi:putative colanic acid biosynthesis acetyltransferase WcaF